MTKICFISSYPPTHGRLSEYGFCLVEELRNRPDISHIDIITEAGAGAAVEKINEKVTVHRVWKSDNPVSFFLIPLKIIKLRPDVVHFNLHMAVFGHSRVANFLGLSMPFICRTLGFKTVTTLHNVIEKIDLDRAGYKNSFVNRVGAFVITKLIAASSAVTLTMKSYADFFQDRYKCKHVEAIPHGTWKSNSPRDKLVCNNDSILYVGHSGPYKDLGLLFEAFSILEKKNRALKLIVAGESHPDYPRFLDHYKNYGNFENVLFTGYVPEAQLQALFEKANAVILPYYTCTGTSGVAHLASSYGTPIVATDLPEFRELAREGCGLLISQHRADALAGRIEEIIDNPKLALKLKERNLSFASARSWENVASRFCDLYEKVLEDN